MSRARVSELARGDGVGASLGAWIRMGLAIDRPLAVSFSRVARCASKPRDAGHLAAQELVLRLVARIPAASADFELPTRPADPARSIDVAIRDEADRDLIVVVEIWNRLDDVGSGGSRHVAKGFGGWRAWRDRHLPGTASPTASPCAGCSSIPSANRRLVQRYPEIMRSRFPGSSHGMGSLHLSEGSPPPDRNRAVRGSTPARTGSMPLRFRGTVLGGI